MPFVEDLSEFIDTGDFATTANFTSPALGSVDCIFDNETAERDTDRVTVLVNNPFITCVTSDLTGVSEGSLCTIDGTNYSVRERMDDGTGITMLNLELA